MNAPSVLRPNPVRSQRSADTPNVALVDVERDIVNNDKNSGEDGGVTRVPESMSGASTQATAQKQTFNQRFRSQSAQFFIYLVSLLAAFSVNGVVQESVSKLALWIRALISAALVCACLVFVTIVSVWATPES